MNHNNAFPNNIYNQQLPSNNIALNSGNGYYSKNKNINQRFHGFKKKRHLEYEIEDDYMRDYKRQRLIEDFNRLNLSTSAVSNNIAANPTINIKIKNTESSNGDTLLKDLKNDYFMTQFLHNWQLAIFINWSIFLYFVYLNRFRSLHTKLRNILYWKLSKGIVHKLPIWEYYYNDCYEASTKYHNLGKPDVEMEM